MNDLIERQAAIKAIEDLHDSYNGFSDTYDKACIIGALEEVPSAQTEIVRCRECKWWEKQEDSTLGYCNAAKHCYYSLNWEVQIYRRHRADFFCADGERRSENERPN